MIGLASKFHSTMRLRACVCVWGGGREPCRKGPPPQTPLGVPRPPAEWGLGRIPNGCLGAEPPATFLRRSRPGVWGCSPNRRAPLSPVPLLATALGRVYQENSKTWAGINKATNHGIRRRKKWQKEKTRRKENNFIKTQSQKSAR